MNKRLTLLKTDDQLAKLRLHPETIDDYEVNMALTMRHGIVAPPGYVLVSCDFSAQEIRIAGWVSKDPKILEVYTCNPTILGPDGKQYDNPKADMHTITASMCCYPDLFRNEPEWKHVAIAKDDSLIAEKGK